MSFLITMKFLRLKLKINTGREFKLTFKPKITSCAIFIKSTFSKFIRNMAWEEFIS